jgi:hypothetical protein
MEIQVLDDSTDRTMDTANTPVEKLRSLELGLGVNFVILTFNAVSMRFIG